MSHMTNRILRTAIAVSASLTLTGVAFAPQTLAALAALQVLMCDGRPVSQVVVAGMVFNDLPGAHVIQGTTGNDVINAGDGDDHVCGLDGNDVIKGGEGNDVLRGGKGDDELQGDNGDDKLFGFEDRDTMSGNAGADGGFCGTGGADIFDGGVTAGDVDHFLISADGGCEVAVSVNP